MSIKAHYGGLKNAFKVGSFTRDTALASGSQAVTGIGFKPKAVIFLSCQSTVVGEASWGLDDGSNPEVIYDDHNDNVDEYVYDGSFSIYDEEGGGAFYTGKINSMDADGFTVGWTRTGAPTGTVTVIYLAIGGDDTALTESDYGEKNFFAVGHFRRDSTVASGNQAITGVGFQPKAVVFLMCDNLIVGEGSFGVDDGSSKLSLVDYFNITPNAWEFDNGASIKDIQAGGGGDEYEGYTSTFGADGFTITWTRTNAPSGNLYIMWMAFA